MRRRSVTLSLLTLAALAGGYLVLRGPTLTWTRENPLANAIAVASVQDGVLTLADGQVIRPAGVQPRDDVSIEQYDEFLRIAVAQGIVVERVLDDERAFVRVEPRFKNTCGTSQRDLNWAGTYRQCPLSEFAVISGFADPDMTQLGLSDRERWRLTGTRELSSSDIPMQLMGNAQAVRYDGRSWVIGKELEFTIEAVTKTAPPS